MKTALFSIIVFAGLYTPSAGANTFNVFCVPSLDGVSTCSGWKQDQKLQCISSPGGVASCRSSEGTQFACTQDVSGLTTCGNNEIIPSQSRQNCTAIGNGSFTCEENEQSNTKIKSNSEELNAVSDIIGESTESPIDKDLTGQHDFNIKPSITDIPTLKP